MNILIIGASGFVGTWVTRELINSGYTVYCAVRNQETIIKKFPQAIVVSCNLHKDISVKDWLPRLTGIDIIINCAGIFYHPNSNIIWNIHYYAPKALFEAAEIKKVRQIIHLSALGIENYKNPYSESKLAAENFLKTLTIPYVILKPSFIYGPGAKGGISLIHILAALPKIILIPGRGKQRFQPIYIGDLTKAIKNLITLPTSISLAAVSVQQISLKEIVLQIRDWLGLPTACIIKIPIFLIKLLAKFGNLFPYSIFNSAAINMLEKENITSAKETQKFQENANIHPVNFAEGLKLNPATSCEYWTVLLPLLRTSLRLSLSFMWIMSAITSILPSTRSQSYFLLSKLGLSFEWQPLLLYSAVGLNSLIGLGLLFNYKIKINCFIQLAIIFIYTLIITISLPYLWLEPFGPVVKNIPIIMAIIILFSMDKK